METTLVRLADLMDPAELDAAVEAGYVKVQRHPNLPLEIRNYTARCQYERAWTEVTRQCRGLITDDSGVVVARAFEKFFNYGEFESDALDLTAETEVTDKMDGCFPRGTTVNLWGGGTVTIDEVVTKRLPVTLVGMNEHGDLVPALVTDWHSNGRKDHWLDIEVDAPVSRRSGAGGHPNRLRVTVNHHIHVNGEYRPAIRVRPGDRLITQTWRPSGEVIRLVRASLLGDGCLVQSATRPGQARYQEPHSEKQADYVAALRKALGDCAATRADTVSGYGSRMVWAGSREYEALGDLRREWYPDGVKRIPADLSWMDDYAVAKWLMDDGCRQKFAAQADRISFSTHSFDPDDIVRLGDRLAEMYGISYHLSDDSGHGMVLVVNSGRRQQIEKLWGAVTPHVHPSMRYKVPERYQDVPYSEPEAGCELTVARETTVTAVMPVEPVERNFPSGRTGFDITTATGNYMARGVLVHNSLGILYPVPDGWAIATRGSFASEQALHATALLRDRYPDFTPPRGMTCLFEIIYPANRIVVDYGGMDDLVLLGAVDIATGRTVGPDWISLWDGPAAETFPYASLADALAAEPRDGCEGLVVHFPGTGQRVKIKQSEYVALHRILTQTTARTVWEFLAVAACKHLIASPKHWGSRLGLDPARAAEILETGDGWLDRLLDGVPDEFHAWLHATIASIEQDVATRGAGAGERFAPLAQLDRKSFAGAVADDPDKGLMFLLYDGRDVTANLWKAAYPPAGKPFTDQSEDVA